MSVKTKLARQAVKTTAKHTAHGAAARFTRKPARTITLLTIGATVGGLVGWLIGRRSGAADEAPFEPTHQPSVAKAPTPAAADVSTANSTEPKSETGAAS